MDTTGPTTPPCPAARPSGCVAATPGGASVTTLHPPLRALLPRRTMAATWPATAWTSSARAVLSPPARVRSPMLRLPSRMSSRSMRPRLLLTMELHGGELLGLVAGSSGWRSAMVLPRLLDPLEHDTGHHQLECYTMAEQHQPIHASATGARSPSSLLHRCSRQRGRPSRLGSDVARAQERD